MGSGSMLCIDEGRVKSKSKRNSYKITNPEKRSKLGEQYIVLKNATSLVVMIILRKSDGKHIPQLPVEKPVTSPD